MLSRLRKRSGNKYTLISIVLIILVFYSLRFVVGSKTGDYPQDVYYGNYKFQYTKTINEASYKFVRKYGVSYNGYMLLLKRGENWDTAPSKVYIFTSRGKYREYELVQW